MNIKNLQSLLTKDPSLPLNLPTGTPKELSLFLCIPEDIAAQLQRENITSGDYEEYIDVYVENLETLNVVDPESASEDIYLNGLVFSLINALTNWGDSTDDSYDGQDVAALSLVVRYLNGAGRRHCLPKNKPVCLDEDAL